MENLSNFIFRLQNICDVDQAEQRLEEELDKKDDKEWVQKNLKIYRASKFEMLCKLRKMKQDVKNSRNKRQVTP